MNPEKRVKYNESIVFKKKLKTQILLSDLFFGIS